MSGQKQKIIYFFLKKLANGYITQKKNQVLTNQHINRETNQHEDDLLIREVWVFVGIPEKPIGAVEHQMAMEGIKKTENFSCRIDGARGNSEAEPLNLIIIL